MASKLSIILDGLQQQLLLLNELVARVAALQPADNQQWDAVGNNLKQLYSELTVHIAIIQVLLSRSFEDGHALTELDVFAHALQKSEQTFEALRAVSLSTSSNPATQGTSSQHLTSSHTAKPEMTEELEYIRTSLRTAMAALLRSFSLGINATAALHTLDSNDSEVLQAAFSLRPFALTSADMSALASRLHDHGFESYMEYISTWVNDVAKAWVQSKSSTTFTAEPSVLSCFWSGGAASMTDAQCHVGLSESTSAQPRNAALLATVGSRLKQFASTRKTVAFVGPSGCGKSAMINALVGVHLIVPGIPTSVPCRVRHHPGLPEPTLELAIEPYLVALQLLREYGFTQQCSHWKADRATLSIGRPEAPDSFRKAWDVWTSIPRRAALKIAELEHPDFQLAPKTTGLDQVTKLLGYLDALALFCRRFGLPFDPLRHEWPVINLAFNPSPDSQQASELINLPGYRIQTLTEEDLPYLGQLVEEGAIVIPVMSIERHYSESRQITKKLPELLHQFDSPIPCVMVTYFDAIRRENSEALDTRRLVASMFWDDRDRFDDVLLCSPAESITATFVLRYIDTHGCKPPYEDIWKDRADLRYWSLRKLSNKQDEVAKMAQYNKYTAEDIQRILTRLQEDSHVTPVISAYYRAISAPRYLDEAAAVSRRRLNRTLNDKLASIDAFLMNICEPGTRPDASIQGDVSHDLSKVLDDLRGRASEEIIICLRNAYASVCHSDKKAGILGGEQDNDALLLTVRSLRAILQQCQKAAEQSLAGLRSLLAEELMHRVPTGTATDPNQTITDIVSRLPTTSTSVPIDSLSSFKISDLRVLLSQPFNEPRSPNQHEHSLLRRATTTIAALARALSAWPHILIHHRRGYYRLSLAALRERMTSDIVAPWVEEMGRVAEKFLAERVGLDSGVTSSAEMVDPQTCRHLDMLLALRCNVFAVLAVLN